jgi:methylenetetrahydrofolate--tRNA-(uracil-5-)-methyltransferase
MGVVAGLTGAALVEGRTPVPPPRETAFGSLINYICHAETKTFQPANITFDLLPQLYEGTRRRVRDKKERHRLVCEKALQSVANWLTAAAPSPKTAEQSAAPLRS